MTIRQFEDLEIWKDARDLCKLIHKHTETQKFSGDYALKNQIRKSAGSVMDNIAEGFERDGRKEFIQFLYISKGSLGETRSQIHRSFDQKLIIDEEYTTLVNMCLSLSKRIASFIQYLSKSELEGIKKKTVT